MNKKRFLLWALLASMSIGLKAQQVNRWEFTNGLDGWGTQYHCTSSWTDGTMALNVTGNDPQVHFTPQGTWYAGNIKYLWIRIKNTTTDKNGAQLIIFPFGGGNSGFRIPLPADDTDFHEVYVDLTQNPLWVSTLRIDSFRIDPIDGNNGESGNVYVDFIRFVEYKGDVRNPQSLSAFNLNGYKDYSSKPFAVDVTSNSGLPVTVSVSGPAQVQNNVVTLTGEKGLVELKADQPGNTEYSPASVIQTFYVIDSLAIFTNKSSPQIPINNSNWVATDALNRTIPSYEETGTTRKDKYVGVFYLNWLQGGGVYDNTKILAGQQVFGPRWAFHFWGEPEVGYYHSDDPWVIRRDMNMLANAGIDFIYIDMTNGYTYWDTLMKLCKIMQEMRDEGIPVPYLMFWATSSKALLYESVYKDFYLAGLYPDLWYRFKGKPVLMFKEPLEVIENKEIQEFFTLRWAWVADYYNKNQKKWDESEGGQYYYDEDPNIPECYGVPTALAANGSRGRSYDMITGKQPASVGNCTTSTVADGIYFRQQWDNALKIDPQIVIVSRWNEWVAQRFIQGQDIGGTTMCGKTLATGDSWFVDQYNHEFSRDIQPMKGGHTDSYYYQLINYVRKFKGMQKPDSISDPKTITTDGNFSEWSTVTPVFKDAPGDVANRNFRGYDPAVTYTNTTGRNDIVESRATYDTDNIYFYVKTAQGLTPCTDPNWMLLFIDIDRNKGTGWEGYDYIVNLGVKSTTETTLKQWDGKSWSNEFTIPYKLTGNEMELSLPRTAVLTDKSTPEFYFHWSDNAQQLDSISCFFTDGESAPDRRFNYNFSSSKIQPVLQTSYKDLVIPGTIEFEDFDNGGAGTAYADATFGNIGNAYRPNESVDIEAKTGGSYNLGWVNTNEWLEYTANVNAIGKFTASINYAANGAGKEALLYVDDNDRTGVISFPSTGNIDTWSNKEIDLQLASGKHILKFFVKNAADDLKLDKIVFTEKDVVYPGKGTGLDKSLWKGSAPGTWFKDSICSEIDPVIDEYWTDVSPGCGIAKDFWNARWQGQIEPLFSELYTFYLTVNDLGRVWINNQLVVDGWVSTSSGKTITGTIALTAGQKVPIKVDFAEKAGEAKVKLEWSSASNPIEVVPQSQLYPQTLINGISDNGLLNFSVYPNPATDRITIQTGKHHVESIRIIDVAGRTVYTGNESFAGTKSFSLTLAKGIYLVKLTGNSSFKTQKLIIK